MAKKQIADAMAEKQVADVVGIQVANVVGKPVANVVGKPVANVVGKPVANVQRLSINISDQTAVALKSLAERHGTTVTNIVRRAVGVYQFLDDEIGESDSRSLQIVDEKKKQITTIAIV